MTLHARFRSEASIAEGEARIRVLERDLARSRDLASIGEAAAAILHEIKNALAAVSAPLQVIREQLNGKEDVRAVLQEIIAEIHRLDGVARRLLMFSKPWKPNLELHDLLGIIRHVLALSGGKGSFERIRFRVERADRGHVLVDADLFEQVLWNLLQNAAEALEQGGEIRLSCVEDEREVLVRISDDGPGMAPEVQASLTKRFFTTKPGGIGLGLAISRKIMEAHQGSLLISSQVGRGTEVTLQFPKAA